MRARCASHTIDNPIIPLNFLMVAKIRIDGYRTKSKHKTNQEIKMIRHLSPEERERYTDFAMSPDEILAADAHLADCPQCRNTVAVKFPIMEQIADVQVGLNEEASAPSHLSFELLLGYLEDRLGSVDHEAVRSHLAMCPRCSAEVDDLRRFRAEMSTYEVRSYTPVKPRNFMERILTRRPAKRTVGIWGLTAAAAAMAFAVSDNAPPT